MVQRKRKRRPKRALTIPEGIPDSPENIIKVLLNSPPKKENEWRYLNDERTVR